MPFFDQLENLGFVLLEGLMTPKLLRAVHARVAELFDAEGAGAGSEFKQEPGALRLANLVNKGRVFQSIVAHPETLKWVRAVLGPDLKLSSLNARRALPRNGVAQPLHADMGARADANGFWVCNTIWMLDDFTERNGALRVVPGSHRWDALPEEALENPLDPHPDEIRITGKAGSVAVMNAHLWHGGLANETGRTRTALHAFYCRRDKPQQQHQKALLDPEVQTEMSLEMRTLLALDDPENDRLNRTPHVKSGFLKV